MWVQGILQEQMWVQDVVQNVGSGNPPRRADVELEVILPPGLDLADGHAKEVVAELGRMAAKTPSRWICRSEWLAASTVEFNFGTGNRWFYLLKCTVCKRMAMGRAMGR